MTDVTTIFIEGIGFFIQALSLYPHYIFGGITTFHPQGDQRQIQVSQGVGVRVSNPGLPGSKVRALPAEPDASVVWCLGEIHKLFITETAFFSHHISIQCHVVSAQIFPLHVTSF